MQLLLAMRDPLRAEHVATLLYSRREEWQITCCHKERQLFDLLEESRFDLLLLYMGVQTDQKVIAWLGKGHVPCLPVVLLLAEPGSRLQPVPDCIAPTTATAAQLCKLLETLAQKPLPHLALQMQQRLRLVAEAFLDELAMPKELNGRTYAAWLLARLLPLRLAQRQKAGDWYRLCAANHGTTPAAVERCLRVAVESVFTQGNMQAIERCFGATVDPEKGKPTNRAFLLKAAEYLRRTHYSLTDTRSLNSSEMHHNPAAPTSV